MKRVINHSKDWKLTEDIKTGFTVPESYFTGIEDELFSKLIEEKLPKHNGFKTPKSYFEELEDLIIKKNKINICCCIYCLTSIFWVKFYFQ
jgi:hypothetical protein